MREVIALIAVAACASSAPPAAGPATPATPTTPTATSTPAATPTPPVPVAEPASDRLRITEPVLYRLTPARRRERVAEHGVLRTNDRIQIDVLADRAAYVYVLQKNGKGAIDVIAPAPDEGLLAMQPNTTTTIPDPKVGYDIELDEVTGNDTIYVVVSVAPLEIALDDSDAPAPSQAAPKPARPKPTQRRVLVPKPASAVGGPAPLIGRSNGYQAKGVRRTPKPTEQFQLEVEAPDRDDVIVRELHFRHE